MEADSHVESHDPLRLPVPSRPTFRDLVSAALDSSHISLCACLQSAILAAHCLGWVRHVAACAERRPFRSICACERGRICRRTQMGGSHRARAHRIGVRRELDTLAASGDARSASISRAGKGKRIQNARGERSHRGRDFPCRPALAAAQPCADLRLCPACI